MNDDHALAVIRDRLSAARDSLREVPRTIPASQIIARAGKRRARRWLISARGRPDPALNRAHPGPARPAATPRHRVRTAALAACALAAAGAAVAVPAVLPGGGPGSVVTAAWAVTRGPGGTVKVTFGRTLRDFAGLQHALRADGVRAYVRSTRCGGWLPSGGVHNILQNSPALRYVNPGVYLIRPARLPEGQAIFLGGYKYPGGGESAQAYVMRGDRPPVKQPGTAVINGKKLSCAAAGRPSASPAPP